MHMLMGTPESFTSDYSALSRLRQRWDAADRKYSFACRSIDEWSAWRLEFTAALKLLCGYDTMVPADPVPRLTGTREFPDHTRERVEIRTEPGITMPFFVLIPKNMQPPFPAVIALPGHRSGGKLAVAGCREIPEIEETIAVHNYDYGLQLVREGNIVFCPDPRGHGERQEPGEESRLSASCSRINHMALPLGQTLLGMQVWDVHRLIDYIQTRKECRSGSIACVGFSGGGLQCLWAAALDERISAAVISGYMYGSRDSLLDLSNNCSCNYIPRLWGYADMGDIAALIAPRPLCIESGTDDPLNGHRGLANVYPQTAVISRAYSLLNKGENFRHAVFSGGHRWHGEESIPWLKSVLADPALHT